jgi:amino acid transporter
MTAPAASPATGGKELRRDIGLVGLTWASVGSIIGSGWLFGAQRALGVAGPSAIISWLIGAVAITILALVHAELGGMYPVSGGTARFPHFVFGGFAGASFGWFSWLQAATVAPIEVLAMMGYAASHYSWANGFLDQNNSTLTGTGILVAVGLMAVMVVINLISVRLLSQFNSALTWWKVAIPILTIIVLMSTHFHTSNFTAGDGFAPGGIHGIFSAVASGGIIFALLGFEQADQLAGESRNPKRDIPVAIITSMIIGTIVYVLLEAAFTGAIPGFLIPTHWTSPDALAKVSGGPFAQLTALIGLGWLSSILFADAVISPGGTGLIYTTATSRVSYGLARNGYFPKPFEWVNRARVPWFGLIVSFVLGCLIFLPFPSWNSLVGIITSVSVLMYAGAPLALGALRKRMPHANRPYRLAGGEVVAPVAFVVANLLILWTGWDADWKIGVAIAVGYVLILGNVLLKLNDVKPPMNFEASMWIPVYLLGMGVIVYFSSFGHDLVHPKLPFGWDALVTAVFSLLIYFWAIAVALPSEIIARNVDETVLPEDAELALATV